VLLSILIIEFLCFYASVFCFSLRFSGIVSRAGMIQELVMVRDGLLCMSTDDFTHNYVLALIEHLCVD